MKFNPFNHLIQTKKYPTSHLVGSSLWERVDDVFEVFFGSGFKNNLGILDYLFPLPLILQAVCSQFGVPESLGGGMRLTLGLVEGLFLVSSAVKLLAASFLTIAVAPFVGLTHIFFSFRARQAKDAMKNLQVRDVISPCRLNQSPKFLESRKLGSFSSDRYIAGLISKHDFGSHVCYSTGSFHPEAEVMFGLYEPSQGLGFMESSGTLLGAINVNPDNREGIKAMLGSNMFKSADNVKDQSRDFDLFDEIDERIKVPSYGS